QLCVAYNQTLEAALDALADAGLPTIRVDAFATLDVMVNSPAQFGFTNVTQPFLIAGGDPAQFLYWDPVHPTTLRHRGLADEARDALVDYYSPRRGRGLPPAAVNSLNGLVGAGKPKP